VIFKTSIQDIPVMVEVIHYQAPRPMRVTGSGFGDADPPEEEEFDFQLFDNRMQHSTSLDEFMSDDSVHAQLLEEFKTQRLSL
jgi:hypothetical protein